jgi:selenide, water dikinase
MKAIRLTQFSKAAGCGCKIAPEALQEILGGLHALPDKHLLVGNDSRDDAAVYDIGSGECIVSTTDFFMPIVDDAFDFGQVAAANAISDVYAMGGRPIMAISVLAWPVDKLPAREAQKVLQGAISICRKAGIPLAGGHSIGSSEPVFGLAVTGLIRKEHIKKNNSVRNGDLLYLTKPLGTGIQATALKRGLLDPAHYPALIANMTTLNEFGSVCGTLDYVHAMTDVTGFGLLGHLEEMVGGSESSAEVEVSRVPLLEGTDGYNQQYIYPDNTTRNYNAVKEKVSWLGGMEFITLCDPQTSGGLLIAVDPRRQDDFEKALAAHAQQAFRIGRATGRQDKAIMLR